LPTLCLQARRTLQKIRNFFLIILIIFYIFFVPNFS
jgi:hypothetical protein